MCRRPSCSTSRRASYWSIRAMSWVAITTEVPDLFSSMNSRSRRCARLGSTLPVGSSASSSCGPRDHRAGDRRALLLAAGEHRRQRPHALAEAHPVEQLDHLVAVALLRPAHDAQRQRDVFVGGHMIEQAEILEHDADAAAQRRDGVLRQGGDVMAELGDQARASASATGTAAAAARSCRRRRGR